MADQSRSSLCQARGWDATHYLEDNDRSASKGSTTTTTSVARLSCGATARSGPGSSARSSGCIVHPDPKRLWAMLTSSSAVI